MEFQIVARTGHPDFLDLPWDLPLEEWSIDRLVTVARGISRHVVRFVRYDESIYAVIDLRRKGVARAFGGARIPSASPARERVDPGGRSRWSRGSQPACPA